MSAGAKPNSSTKTPRIPQGLPPSLDSDAIAAFVQERLTDEAILALCDDRALDLDDSTSDQFQCFARDLRFALSECLWTLYIADLRGPQGKEKQRLLKRLVRHAGELRAILDEFPRQIEEDLETLGLGANVSESSSRPLEELGSLLESLTSSVSARLEHGIERAGKGAPTQFAPRYAASRLFVLFLHHLALYAQEHLDEFDGSYDHPDEPKTTLESGFSRCARQDGVHFVCDALKLIDLDMGARSVRGHLGKAQWVVLVDFYANKVASGDKLPDMLLDR